MAKRKRTDADNTDPTQAIFDTNNTVSGTEATGLMPAATGQDGAENIGELYSIHPPKDAKKKKK